MRSRTGAALLIGAALAAAPATAQQGGRDRGGVPTVTQERLAADQDTDTMWNVLGLLGLLGLWGLRRPTDNDGYKPDPID